MKFRKFDNLNDFIEHLHTDGFGLIDYQNHKIPCIYVKKEMYENIIMKTFGKKYVVDVLLNIFYDGRYVFVEILLDFVNLELEKSFLMNVNEIDFFEFLYQYGLLAILPKPYSVNSSSNVFIIQLPNKDKIGTAVELIKSNMNKIKYNEGE